MRTAIILLACLCITSFALIEAPGNKTINPMTELQQFYNGMFAYVDLEAPKTLVASCYNETTANATINMLGVLVADLAGNQAIQGIMAFDQYLKQMPKDVLEKLALDQDFDDMLDSYNLTSYIGNPYGFIQTLVVYLMNNYDNTHDTTTIMTGYYKNKDFEDFGRFAGTLVKGAFVSDDSDF